MQVKFFVPGKPQGKGRPRATARGKFVKMYTPSKTVTYESTIALFAKQAMAGKPPLDNPAIAKLWVYMPIPKSWSKKRKLAALSGETMPITKPDADNVVKAVFDAINNIVWIDDVQVVALSVFKKYSETPGVDVEINFLEG